MRFKTTPALHHLLHTQIAEFPFEAEQRPWPGCTVYAKLAAASASGTVDITEDERAELISLLDSIVGIGGWDTLYPAERRTGQAALKRLRKG